MSETSDTYNPVNSSRFAKYTYSRALADGLTHSDCLVGETTNRAGQEAALVAHSVVPESALAQVMSSAIFGPLFGGSSPSEDLQLSLGNRLQRQLTGWPMYELIWKSLVIGLEPPICQLAASAHHTSGSDCGGLPTPSGASNHGKNHVVGRLDEWGGSSNPLRGTELGSVRCVSFELWMMGFPTEWRRLMPPGKQSCRKSRQSS